jgi:hypothetical protein
MESDTAKKIATYLLPQSGYMFKKKKAHFLQPPILTVIKFYAAMHT